MTQGYTKGVPIDTDPTMALNSNQVVPSQAAVVTYVNNVTLSNALPSTATANQILVSRSLTTPVWSTATYPSTTTAGSLFASTATNVVGQISTSTVPNFLMANGSGVVPIYTTIPLYTSTYGYSQFGGF